MDTQAGNPVHLASARDKTKLRMRYNKLVIIDLKKRAILRNLIKQNTRCEHKQIYTQANAICRRISSAYEEDKISAKQAMDLMIEAHEKMSHHNLPKSVICDEMNKRLNKLGKGQDAMTLEITMANVSVNNRIKNQQEATDMYTKGTEDRYSESYWAEVV